MKKLVIAMILSLSSLFIFNTSKVSAALTPEGELIPEIVVVNGSTPGYISTYLDYNRTGHDVHITLTYTSSSTFVHDGEEINIGFGYYAYEGPWGQPSANAEFENSSTSLTVNWTDTLIVSGTLPTEEYGNIYNIVLTFSYFDPVDLSDYGQGFTDGYDYGYTAGYDEGNDDGYNEGYDVGYDVGYDTGIQEGNPEAYQQGYKEGAEESFLGNFDTWIVPAIIVVMFVGGFFAIVRMKRDNL